MTLVLRQTFDGRYRLGLHRAYGDDTTACQPPIEEHRTGSAHPHSATEFGAGESQLIAQYPQQRSIRVHLHVVVGAIDVESDHVQVLATLMES